MSSTIRSTYPVHVAQPLDDQIESFLVVAHAPKQEDHLRNQIALVTYVVRLCTKHPHKRRSLKRKSGAYLLQVVVIACPEKVDKPPRSVFCVQLDLESRG